MSLPHGVAKRLQDSLIANQTNLALVPLLQDNQLEAQPGSRLPVVIDSHGREVDRNALVAREQTVR